MTADIGIHLFLLMLSVAGMLFAILPLRRRVVLRGRIRSNAVSSGLSYLLLVVSDRHATQQRLNTSGLFRSTFPAGGRAVLKVVQDQRVILNIQIRHRAEPVQRTFPLRHVFDLGDIVPEDWGRDGYNMRIHYRVSDALIITAGNAPMRSAPLDRQLLDHTHTLAVPRDARVG